MQVTIWVNDYDDLASSRERTTHLIGLANTGCKIVIAHSGDALPARVYRAHLEENGVDAAIVGQHELPRRVC